MFKIKQILLPIIILVLVLSFKIPVSEAKSYQRLAGQSRYETAVAISREGWPDGSEKVILARGDMFPDALAGVALATKYNAPILLTYSYMLNAAAREEIKRLKAKEVYILGSDDAVFDQVLFDLTIYCSIPNAQIHRLGGVDRYETARLIAKEIKASQNTAIIATGENYPDALCAASISGSRQIPIILVTGSVVTEKTKQCLNELGIKKVTIVGGIDVVSKNIENWFALNNYSTLRLEGTDRYGTAKAIAEYSLREQGIMANNIYVSTGENFPDALAIGSLASRNKGLILLSRENSLPEMTKSLVTTYKASIENVNIIGGVDVLSNNIISQISYLLEGAPLSGLVRISSSGEYEIRNKDGRFFKSCSAGEIASVSFGNNRYFIYAQDFVDISDTSVIFIPKENTLLNLPVSQYPYGTFGDPSDVVYNRYFRGTIEITYSPQKNALVTINELPVEYYLMGMAEEVPESGNTSFLKLMTVIGRSYVVAHHLRGGKHPDEFADIYNTGEDQCYGGVYHEFNEQTEAVSGTAGRVVVYNNQVALTPYFSCSDGRTRYPHEVGWSDSTFPFCKSVPDPYCAGQSLRGHGVGLSAEGARQYALHGYEWDWILKYYYSGISIGDYPDIPVRIAIYRVSI